MKILDAYGVLSLARGFVSEKIRWEADPMRRGVGRPVIRLCCFLCPVCPPPAQPVIWGHPVTTADREGVRPFSGPGGAVGARGTPQAVCARQSAPLRVLRRAVDCGWGGVTRGSCRTSCALEDTSCVSGPLRSAPCPGPSSSAHEVVGTPGHARALAQLAGARRPPALSPQRPPARHRSRACRRRA